MVKKSFWNGPFECTYVVSYYADSGPGYGSPLIPDLPGAGKDVMKLCNNTIINIFIIVVQFRDIQVSNFLCIIYFSLYR